LDFSKTGLHRPVFSFRVAADVRACCPRPGVCPSSGTATLKPIKLLGFSCIRLTECALFFPFLSLGNTPSTRLLQMPVTRPPARQPASRQHIHAAITARCGTRAARARGQWSGGRRSGGRGRRGRGAFRPMMMVMTFVAGFDLAGIVRLRACGTVGLCGRRGRRGAGPARVCGRVGVLARGHTGDAAHNNCSLNDLTRAL